ncbi:LacI family DNA-binding transcriptional regulator [Segnochrobactraceae bacterium EtOH-i3]
MSRSDVTLKDIARLAGVSVATASRVVNRTGLVAPEKRRAVEAVLEQANYVPNQAARSLVSRRSMTVGVVVPTLANPLFAPTIDGAEATLHRAGYGVLIACSHRDPATELEHVRRMLERGVDGLILTGANHHADLMGLVTARGVPLVTQDDPAGLEGATALAMPDAAAMAAAIDHLVGRGHRRIGVLTGPTGNTRPIAERVRGARERLRHHGLSDGPDRVAEAPDYDALPARAATARLLDAHPDLTAIACTGDILSLGLIMECRARGLVVPDDLSVIGCGDTVMAQFVDPGLTTIHLPFQELGTEAARLLLDRLAGRQAPAMRVMGFHLVDRASVARR